LWKNKGYYFPKDIGLLAGLFILLVYYSLLLRFASIQDILNRITRLKNSPKKRDSIIDPEIMLDKVWRGCNFFLRRVFRSTKPCLRRSLVMYDLCCRYGIKTNIIIGICKEGTSINGHSWILIDGIPFKDDIELLRKYTPMLER
jgi:hypothetical protein